MKRFLLAGLLGAAVITTPAVAQQATVSQAIAGTRLDINATGEAMRVPDIAIITAGVMTRASTATAALEQNAAQMNRMRAALKRAGIDDRDVQTSNISLNPEYRYQDNQAPQLTGYTASNQVNVRFRDIRNTGKILDALVVEGANQISGPNLTIDQPDAALDEARAKALAIGRARAELYARSLGMRVVRLVAVNESGGGYAPPPPMPMMMARGQRDSTRIDPGEQKLTVSLGMTFELQ